MTSLIPWSSENKKILAQSDNLLFLSPEYPSPYLVILPWQFPSKHLYSWMEKHCENNLRNKTQLFRLRYRLTSTMPCMILLKMTVLKIDQCLTFYYYLWPDLWIQSDSKTVQFTHTGNPFFLFWQWLWKGCKQSTECVEALVSTKNLCLVWFMFLMEMFKLYLRSIQP